MTPEEFMALLDTYGADLTRWPHAHRQNAQRLLSTSEAAREAFAEAQMLDAELRAPEPVLSCARRQRLTDSILDNLPDDPMPRRVPPHEPNLVAALPDASSNIKILRPLAPLWAACLGFGMIVGVTLTLGHALPLYADEIDWVESLAIYGGL